MTDRDALIGRILAKQRELRRQVTEGQSHPLLDVHLTMSQLKVMLVLGRLGGTSGQDLARRTGFSLATLTGVIDRLVAQDLVSRGEDPDDRRVRRLALTPAGADLVDRLIAAGEEHQQRRLRQLDLPALEVVAQAFQLLLDAATPEPAPPEPAPPEPAPPEPAPPEPAPREPAPPEPATPGPAAMTGES